MSQEPPVKIPGRGAVSRPRLSGVCRGTTQSSNRAGFSILEVLIAILILALVLIGAAPAFFYGTQLIHRASRRRMAVERANDVMESIMHRDFAQIRNSTRNVSLGAINGTMTVTTQNRTWDGSRVDGKHVRVNIEWSVGNTTSDVELQTLVSRVGAGR